MQTLTTLQLDAVYGGQDADQPLELVIKQPAQKDIKEGMINQGDRTLPIFESKGCTKLENMMPALTEKYPQLKVMDLCWPNPAQPTLVPMF
jgi:hypothetical protein